METFDEQWNNMMNYISQLIVIPVIPEKEKVLRCTDETLFQSKPYQITPLSKVPADVLLALLSCTKTHNHHIKLYVTANLEKITERAELEKRIADEMQKSTPNELFKNYQICTKVTFALKCVAKQALRKIQQTEQMHKKPVRIYECPNCNGWHFTSKPHPRWENAN